MSAWTKFLNLLKKDPVADGNDTFNVQTMLNENWDKIDGAIGDVATPAQKMGLTGELSIGKALGVLAEVGNVHVWKRTVNGTVDFLTSTNPNAYQEGSDEKPAGYTLGDTVTGSFALCQTSDSSMSWDYSDNLVVSENGDISMGTTTRLSLSRNNAVSAAEVLKGKFFISRMSGFPGFEDGKIYYMPVDATITKNVALYTNMYQIPVGYPTIPANTTIEYLGSLGDKTRIEMGSYAGTGVFGKSNPNSLTFGFAPKIVIIERDYYFFEISVFIRGVTLSAISTVNASGNDIKLTWTDKAVSWYSNNAGYQLNSTPLESGSYKGKGKYFYIAIG